MLTFLLRNPTLLLHIRLIEKTYLIKPIACRPFLAAKFVTILIKMFLNKLKIIRVIFDVIS